MSPNPRPVTVQSLHEGAKTPPTNRTCGGEGAVWVGSGGLPDSVGTEHFQTRRLRNLITNCHD
jgi:hypothetical protein